MTTLEQAQERLEVAESALRMLDESRASESERRHVHNEWMAASKAVAEAENVGRRIATAS